MHRPAACPTIRRHIQVRGIVQGVGFRPFVYSLATSLGLTGYVFNSSAGVTIEIEGAESDVQKFLGTLRSDPPQLSEITDITVSDVDARGDTAFSILHSRQEAGEFVLISPDAGTCDLCWRDFGDPQNRRYGYPFTNCTHCGPRYTIIQDIPYDRATTTMSRFKMCDACQAEYENPADRRFHAQPNACAVCGPSLALIPRGTSLGEQAFRNPESLPILHQARELLRRRKNSRGEGARRIPARLRCPERYRGRGVAKTEASPRQAFRANGAGCRRCQKIVRGIGRR